MRERIKPGKKEWMCGKVRRVHRQHNEKPLSRGEVRDRATLLESPQRGLPPG